MRLFGFWSIGASVMILALIGWLLALRHKTVPTRPEPRLKAAQVLGRVLLHGLILGLATLGFGTITTFVSLFFDARGWPGAAFALTSFGLGFMLIRLFLADAINRQGGLKVARVSLVFQGAGLLLLWLSGGPGAAISAAALTGAGFALVFPALGVEAIAQVPAQNRGAALGLYSMFLDIGLGFTGPAAGVPGEHL